MQDMNYGTLARQVPALDRAPSPLSRVVHGGNGREIRKHSITSAEIIMNTTVVERETCSEKTLGRDQELSVKLTEIQKISSPQLRSNQRKEALYRQADYNPHFRQLSHLSPNLLHRAQRGDGKSTHQQPSYKNSTSNKPQTPSPYFPHTSSPSARQTPNSAA